MTADSPTSDTTAADALEPALGYRFRDEGLLREALTHASVSDRRASRGERNNERLEFLGDRVLGLVIAEMLLERFPKAREGDIAKRHAVLVSRRTLQAIAADLGIGQHLRLGGGEVQAGSRENPTILADACEALIAALYREGGLELARRFVARRWEPYLDRLEAPPRDPKTTLQEWAQGRGLKLPVYETVDSAGTAHQPLFTVRVSVEGHPPVEAVAASKREAGRDAAHRLLVSLGLASDA